MSTIMFWPWIIILSFLLGSKTMAQDNLDGDFKALNEVKKVSILG